MKKAYTNILFPIIPQLKHNCYLAYILSLIGDCWIYYDEFKILTLLASNIKDAFLHSAIRKRRWLQFLFTNTILPLHTFEFNTPESFKENINLQLPSLFVKTHWNGWFDFIFYLKSYFPYFIQIFIKKNTYNDPN